MMSLQVEPVEAQAPLGGGLLITLLVSLAIYLFCSYCLKRICEKAGHRPGFLIWVPGLQLIPLFRAADLSPWLFLLMFVPIVNLIVFIFLWIGLLLTLERSTWLVLLLFLPIINILLITYLAFSKETRTTTPTCVRLRLSR